MLCFHPQTIKIQQKVTFAYYVDRYITVPCGRCFACRRRHQQDWSIRIQHEAEYCLSKGGSCYFVTLTYAPENLRYKSDKETGEMYDVPSVCTTDPGLFMRKLRKCLGKRIRYFACGEYGKQFDRPHIHIMLFLDFDIRAEDLRPYVEKSWKFGIVKGIYPFSVRLSEYIAKYSMKQFGDDYTKKEKPFARMSLKPAIGSVYLSDKIKQFHRNSKSFVCHDNTGTPFALPKYYKERIFSKEEIDANNNAVQRMRYTSDLIAIRKNPLVIHQRYLNNVRFEENLVNSNLLSYATGNEF